MFTQKRPERLVIGQVLDERAAQKPTSGGSSETEKKDPTVLPAAFSAIRGRGLRRTVGSQAGLAKERHYLRIESVDSLGVVEPSHRHARDAKTADPRELVGNLLGRSDQWQRTPAGDEGTCLLRDDLRRQAPRPAADPRRR